MVLCQVEIDKVPKVHVTAKPDDLEGKEEDRCCSWYSEGERHVVGWKHSNCIVKEPIYPIRVEDSSFRGQYESLHEFLFGWDWVSL